MEKDAFTFFYSFAFSEYLYFHEEQGFAWSEWKKCRERKYVYVWEASYENVPTICYIF